MNQGSSIIRMLCGLAILVMCVIQYRTMSTALDAGGQPQLFGRPVNMTATQLYLTLGVLGLVGLVMLLAGAVKLFKR
jgi:hypothetical protein